MTFPDLILRRSLPHQLPRPPVLLQSEVEALYQVLYLIDGRPLSCASVTNGLSCGSTISPSLRFTTSPQSK
jgi:hypothetical protein